jgi:hypothetical protein
VQTANFGFLGAHYAKLVQLGALAERYFRDDPSTCLFKFQQFAELVAKWVAAHHAFYVGDRETFEEVLRRRAAARPRRQRGEENRTRQKNHRPCEDRGKLRFRLMTRG